jgi:hypothetical protein
MPSSTSISTVDPLEEALRETNARIATVMAMWSAGHTQQSVMERRARAEEALATSKGEGRYIFLNGGSVGVAGTDTLQALLDKVDAMELEIDLKSSEPQRELTRLLKKKIVLLEQGAGRDKPKK